MIKIKIKIDNKFLEHIHSDGTLTLSSNNIVSFYSKDIQVITEHLQSIGIKEFTISFKI